MRRMVRFVFQMIGDTERNLIETWGVSGLEDIDQSASELVYERISDHEQPSLPKHFTKLRSSESLLPTARLRNPVV
jgi:trimethylamine:corrinoid methyltransferase-like protein